MGLFSVNKKKKNQDLEIEKKLLMSDQIIFEKLSSDEDKYLLNLANQMIDGHPLILSFDSLDIDQANKAVAFFSGVAFGIRGEVLNVKEKVFMFASKDVYEDGTMDDFLKEIVE